MQQQAGTRSRWSVWIDRSLLQVLLLMSARLWMLWTATRDSLWFIPAVMTFGTAALAVVLVEAERSGQVSVGDVNHWLWGGGAEGAQQMLSTIASGLITVTGVVFSVTTVALQLASSQFTPRVLRNFTSDRSNQVVLGVFISTFTYTLLVLRVVRSSAPEQEPFVPRLAIVISLALVLISIGFLIYYINHAARSMQVAFILEQVTRRSLEQVEQVFPHTLGRPSQQDVDDFQLPETQGVAVYPQHAGYLQAVDELSLFGLGQRKNLSIRMERRIGEFVLPSQPLATVWSPQGSDEAMLQAIRAGFVLGHERTPEQDIEFGIIEIADIAVKALSPAINDPTTALNCIDRLAEILSLLARRHPPHPIRTQQGIIHFQALYTDFGRAVELAFRQIHHFGADHPVIKEKLVATVALLLAAVPEPRKPPLLELAAKLQADH